MGQTTIGYSSCSTKEAEENYTKDYKAWEDAMAAYDESLKIDLEKSEAAANAAIKKYNGLKPEDRKKKLILML